MASHKTTATWRTLHGYTLGDDSFLLDKKFQEFLIFIRHLLNQINQTNLYLLIRSCITWFVILLMGALYFSNMFNVCVIFFCYCVFHFPLIFYYKKFHAIEKKIIVHTSLLTTWILHINIHLSTPLSFHSAILFLIHFKANCGYQSTFC